MSLLNAATTTLCLSLMSFTGASCQEREVTSDTLASTSQRARVNAFTVVNGDKLRLDSECLDKELSHLKEIIDRGGLDPVKTEVFAGHPIVTELRNKPHLLFEHPDVKSHASGTYWFDWGKNPYVGEIR